MNNLRVIYDNAINRQLTLAASSTAGTLVAANMLTDIKSQVWRSSGTTETITATWTTAELIAGVVLPFCNLTSGATIRVRGYTNVADASPIFDTGTIFACPAAPLGLWDWGIPLGVNAFSYAGGAYARAWIASPSAVKKLVIDLVDTSNTAGYLEVSRIVCGNYWSPALNADYGVPVTATDTSKHFRNDAGDLMTDTGTKHKTQSLNLSNMSTADRATLWNIVRGNGMSKPMLLSLYPDNSDAELEQTYQIYCKLSSLGAISTPYFQTYSGTLNVEEI